MQMPSIARSTFVLRAPALSRPVWFGRTNSGVFSSAVIAFVVVLITDLLFMESSSRFQHWFIVPISVCGILIGMDALEWLRGRLDLYDPIGLIGILGFHFFFVAPLLHVQWDYFEVGFAPPPDWREWLGYMAVWNAVGLIAYRMCRQVFHAKTGSRRTLWKMDKLRFQWVMPICLIISAAAQAAVYARFGGVVGFMDANHNDPDALMGMGWIFMISESAPILAGFFVVVHLQKGKIRWSRAGVALVGLFVLQLYFGGLRGSRSQTLQLFMWVLGCCHFLIRPVPRRMVYVGCVFVMIFLYFYGFYKSMGADAVQAFTASSEERERLAKQGHKTWEGMVLGDLGRADVQAFILYRLENDGQDFDYAKGRTYLGALTLPIPHWILPERPYTKLKEGTEIQTGSDFDPQYPSSRVYGLAGESMLNFGPFGIPFVFAIAGLLIGWFRSAVDRLLPGDSRFLLVPLGVYSCLAILIGDSDNVVFGLVKDGVLPFLVVAMCSIKISSHGDLMRAPGLINKVPSIAS